MGGERRELAIVIPAFKGMYLEKTLASIETQTDKRFHVYIGDDASPDPIFDIVKASGLYPEQVFYKRFQTNLGKQNLASHWKRCIELSTEPWVWLFSDDDLMSPGCVASFYRALEETQSAYDVYRFNTIIIDGQDRIIHLNPPHPKWEPWYQFAYFLFKNYRLGNQQELIFRRSRFNEIGGFEEFPLSWWSDIAFAIACGTKKGIYTIETELIYMRNSGVNISSKKGKNIYRLKLYAMAEFIAWVVGYIERNECGEFPGKQALRNLALEHFYWRLRTRHSWLSWRDVRRIYPTLQSRFHIPFREWLLRAIFYNVDFLLEGLVRRWRNRERFQAQQFSGEMQ